MRIKNWWGKVWGLLRAGYERIASARQSAVGASGEELAAQHLARKGYRVIARNHRNPGGEIDLIVIQRATRTLVFVEVKSRRNLRDQDCAADRIDLEKQRRLTSAALAYLRRNRLTGCHVRFDVVTVVWDGDGKATVSHELHAFEAARTETCIGPYTAGRRSKRH